MKILFSFLLIAGIAGAGVYFSGSGVSRISPDADMLQLGNFAFQEQRYEDAFNWYQHAANQGLSEGQFYLSQLYQRGQGVEKDETMAVQWMEKSAKQGFAKAEYEYAMMLEFGRGVSKANAGKVARWYQKAAEKNHPDAMLKLSKLYHNGLGFRKDESKALTWAMKAEDRHTPHASIFRQKITKNVLQQAESGVADAQYMLAKLYHEGRGVEQDKGLALEWFTKAAERGHSEAQYALAKTLVEAGDENNLDQALQWFEKAAKQGHTQAGSASVAILAMQGATGERAKSAWRWMYHGMQRNEKKAEYNLAAALNSGLFGLSNSGFDTGPWLKNAAQAGIVEAQNDYAVYLKLNHQDTQGSIKWLTKAALTDVKAQFNLGFIYARGDGVTPDDDSAVHWWGLAEKQGSTRAKMMLGLFFDLGRGVGRSEKKAVTWYKKAAALGDVNALYNLAVLYYNGRGIDRDYDEAAKYFKMIVEMGDVAAQNIYGSLFLDGQGVEYAPEKAILWFERAANAGNVKAMFNLATQYRRGRGVAQNDALAMAWYRKAAELEFAPAQNALAYMYAEGRGTTVDKTSAQRWFERASDNGLMMATGNLIALQNKGDFSLMGLQIDNKLRAGMLQDKNIDLTAWLEVYAQPIL